MKNVLLTTALILSYLIQLQASHSPNPSKLIILQDEKSLILNSPTYTNGTEVLSITDANGALIFTDMIESDKKRIKYNLKALTNSTYTISVVTEDVTNIYETEIFNDKIEILKSRAYYRPAIYKLDGKVVLKAELENKEDILISFYDDNNLLVFQQKIEKDHSFVQSFNLDQLPKGDYEVLVTSEHFVEKINVTL